MAYRGWLLGIDEDSVQSRDHLDDGQVMERVG
jgi:hypothetical protein